MTYQKIDQKINNIKKHLDYLEYFPPINYSSEHKKFFKAFYNAKQYNPQFRYKKINQQRFKNYVAKLKKMKIPNTDPNLKAILGFDKKYTIDLLELLIDLGKPAFYEKAKKLFGTCNPSLVKKAKQNIFWVPKMFPPAKRKINFEIAERKIKRAFKDLKLDDWKLRFIKDGEPGAVYPFKKEVHIIKQQKYDPNFINIIIKHEIYGHVIQNTNAASQDYNFLKYGFGHYEVLSEGHALFQESKVNEHTYNRIYMYYLAVNYGNKHSFFETFCYLLQWFPVEYAYYLTARVKRGVCDTSLPGTNLKDKFYLEGLEMINKKLKKDLDLIKKAKFDFRYIEQLKKIIT